MTVNYRITPQRVRKILAKARQTRVLVVGDVMLDQFIWGSVGRISPEAPVPVVDFERESFMPGGAANVARNLTALKVNTELFGVVGRDQAARELTGLLTSHQIGCEGILVNAGRRTSVKTRIVAHKQQVVRIDRETRDGLSGALTTRLVQALEAKMPRPKAVIKTNFFTIAPSYSGRLPHRLHHSNRPLSGTIITSPACRLILSSKFLPEKKSS